MAHARNSARPADPAASAPRGRRSQAERTADTRARIVEAVYESVCEVGLLRTTAVEVTRRAGLTWGAVQHHFGGKDGMLIAAIEDSFDRFAARLSPEPAGGVATAERVRRFVDGAWAHFSSREYRASFEILLGTLARGDRAAVSADPSPPADTSRWRGEMFRAWDRVWKRFFHDSPLPRRRQLALEHYTISVLAGLASTLMLEGRGAVLARPELGFLQDTLARELTRAQ